MRNYLRYLQQLACDFLSSNCLLTKNSFFCKTSRDRLCRQSWHWITLWSAFAIARYGCKISFALRDWYLSCLKKFLQAFIRSVSLQTFRILFLIPQVHWTLLQSQFEFRGLTHSWIWLWRFRLTTQSKLPRLQVQYRCHWSQRWIDCILLAKRSCTRISSTYQHQSQYLGL